MVKINSLLTRLVLLSLVFVMALVNLVMNVAEGLPFPYIDAIFCFLILFGIAMIIWSKRVPFHRYPGAFLPLLALLVTSCYYGVINIQAGSVLSITIGVLNFVLVFVIIDAFSFVSHVIIIKKFRLIAHLLLGAVIIIVLAIVVLQLINYARTDALSATKALSITSLLVSGLAIPANILLLIQKSKE